MQVDMPMQKPAAQANLRTMGQKLKGNEELERALALQPGTLKYRLALAAAFTADGRLQDASPQLAEIRADRFRRGYRP